MPPSKTRIFKVCIVLFKSLRNSKRRNKGNFTLKSNFKKIMLCGATYLVLNKISMKYFLRLFTIFKLIKQYFRRERLKKIYF